MAFDNPSVVRELNGLKDHIATTTELLTTNVSSGIIDLPVSVMIRLMKIMDEVEGAIKENEDYLLRLEGK